jgi:hypothetical protein
MRLCPCSATVRAVIVPSGFFRFGRAAIAIALALSALLATPAPAQATPVEPAGAIDDPSAATVLPPRPHLRAIRVASPPEIDGQLDDAAWAAAPITDSFTQKFPHAGQPPVDRTSLRIAYDDQALYVAIDCAQPTAPIERRLTRRDRMVEADWVEITLDTRGDGKSGFEFNVNAAGVMTDAIRFDDTEVSLDWDENWEARTALHPGGWAAELRIPLRILRFARLPVQSWGMQARRHVSHRQELDEWAFIPRSSAGEVSHYGHLDDLVGLSPGRGLEVAPFVWERLRRRDVQAGQVAGGTDIGLAAGLDLKWHPSQQLTVDVAVLPDFAQVEADQVLLNLTNLETYLPEKRRFFLEGIDTFYSPEVQVVYTRRIGRPAPELDLAAGERLVDVPAPSPIYGALKLTGHLGDAWEVGVLSALTARNRIEVEAADGTREHRLVDPLTAFNVLRIKRTLGGDAGNGHVGITATSVMHNRHHGAVGANDAHVGSFDWRLASPSHDYVTTGQLLATRLDRGPPRLVPDGTVIGSGDVGTAVRAVVKKVGGAHWLWDVWGARDSRKFDVNDLGYNDRANQYGAGGALFYRTLDPWRSLLESSTKLETVYLHNLDGLATWRQLALISRLHFVNFWSLRADLNGFLPHFDDREVGDGAALERPGGGELELSVETDPRRRVWAFAELSGKQLSEGRSLRLNLSLVVRVLPQLDLELDPELLLARGEPRYAATAANGDLLFGHLAARSVGAILRATYTFTPQLTLQTYAQLFVAARHYADLASFTPLPGGGRPTIRVGDLQPGAPPPAENPDTQEGALNVNVVLRWEFRAGSLLYLVYTRAQAPELTLQPGETGRLDLRSVRRGPAVDVVLLKLSYWWG